VNFEKSVLQTSLFYWFLCFIPAFKSGCQHYGIISKTPRIQGSRGFRFDVFGELFG